MKGDQGMNRASCAARRERQPCDTGKGSPFSAIVEGIWNRNEDAVRLFLETFREGVTLLVGRAGADARILVETCLETVIAEIQQGHLEDSAQLPELVCRTVRLHNAAFLKDSRDGAAAQLRDCLDSCSRTETEILKRYYVEGQTPDFICREMQVSMETVSALLARVQAIFARVGVSGAGETHAWRLFRSARHRRGSSRRA